MKKPRAKTPKPPMPDIQAFAIESRSTPGNWYDTEMMGFGTLGNATFFRSRTSAVDKMKKHKLTHAAAQVVRFDAYRSGRGK